MRCMKKFPAPSFLKTRLKFIKNLVLHVTDAVLMELGFESNNNKKMADKDKQYCLPFIFMLRKDSNRSKMEMIHIEKGSF